MSRIAEIFVESIYVMMMVGFLLGLVIGTMLFGVGWMLWHFVAPHLHLMWS